MKKLLEKYLPSDSFYFNLFCLHFPGCCRPPNCTQICHELQFIKHRQKGRTTHVQLCINIPWGMFSKQEAKAESGEWKVLPKAGIPLFAA